MATSTRGRHRSAYRTQPASALTRTCTKTAPRLPVGFRSPRSRDINIRSPITARCINISHNDLSVLFSPGCRRIDIPPPPRAVRRGHAVLMLPAPCRRCNHLANASAAASATVLLTFLPLPVVVVTTGTLTSEFVFQHGASY